MGAAREEQAATSRFEEEDEVGIAGPQQHRQFLPQLGDAQRQPDHVVEKGRTDRAGLGLS